MTINMEILILIIFIALVVQLVVEAIKVLFKAIGKDWSSNRLSFKWLTKVFTSALLSMFWTILLCFAAKAGIFEGFGFMLVWPILDYVVTGILASLGAGKVYDLFVSMRDYKDKLAIEKTTTVSVIPPPVELGGIATTTKI
ncbi:MAG: hypothetical protein PHE79_08725 [Eubacteriales bacterium]|nr:hypothetical protein [Eubacteriales bacterium]